MGPKNKVGNWSYQRSNRKRW